MQITIESPKLSIKCYRLKPQLVLIRRIRINSFHVTYLIPGKQNKITNINNIIMSINTTLKTHLRIIQIKPQIRIEVLI